MAEPVVALNRRQRRRQETIDEILSHAVAVMAEQGVAGLSLGEVARRMGIRTPSLYGYFPSKHALYDAVFEQGATGILAEMTRLREAHDPRDPLTEQLERGGRTFTAWALAHSVHAQMLFWRPVPGFEPSPAAYAPAVALVQHTRAWFTALHEHGLLRADVDVDDAMQAWIVITAGVVGQQLANAPDETVDNGRYVAALPDLVAMFTAHYGTPSTPSAPRKKVARGNQR